MNTTLIDLYRQIGEIISRRVAAAQWGDGAVDQLARHCPMGAGHPRILAQ